MIPALLQDFILNLGSDCKVGQKLTDRLNPISNKKSQRTREHDSRMKIKQGPNNW
jgi:hypothetical protein